MCVLLRAWSGKMGRLKNLPESEGKKSLKSDDTPTKKPESYFWSCPAWGIRLWRRQAVCVLAHLGLITPGTLE